MSLCIFDIPTSHNGQKIYLTISNPFSYCPLYHVPTGYHCSHHCLAAVSPRYIIWYRAQFFMQVRLWYWSLRDEVVLCGTHLRSNVFHVCCIHLGYVYVYLSYELRAVYTSTIGDRLGVIHLKVFKPFEKSKGTWSYVLHVSVCYVTKYNHMYPTYNLPWLMNFPYQAQSPGGRN